MTLVSCDWDPTGHGHGRGHGNGHGHDNDSSHVENDTLRIQLKEGEDFTTERRIIQLLDASIDENRFETAEVLIISLDGNSEQIILNTDSPTYTTEDSFSITLLFVAGVRVPDGEAPILLAEFLIF